MDKNTFTAAYQGVADKAAQELGVPASALLAQWGLETGWGKSVIPGTNNLGNIKDFSGAGVQATDNLTKSVDRYRAYGSVDEFSKDYVSLIKRRYPSALNQSTVLGFATALKAGGYAEDPEYVSKLVAITGEPAIAPAGAGRGVVNPPVVGQPQASLSDKIEKTLSDAFQKNLLSGRSGPGALDEALAKSKESQDAYIAARPTQLEAFGAAVAGSPLHAIYKNLTRPRFEPEPGFVPDMGLLPTDADSSLVEHFRSARSKAETSEALQHWEDEQRRLRAVSDGGLGNSLLRSLGGEVIDPINVLMPWLAARSLARVGAGSIAAFKAEKVAQGYGSAVVENLISGTVIEAVKQSVEGEFKPADLGISLVADALLGVGMGAWAHHSIGRSLIDSASIATLARESDLAARAERKLGPTATVDELRAEMVNLRKGDLEDLVRTGLGDVPPANRLVEPDAPKVSDGLSPKLYEPDLSAPVPRSPDVGGVVYDDLVKLGIDLPPVSDKVARNVARSALSSEAGIHLPARLSGNADFKKLSSSLEGLRKQMLPDVAIHLTDGGTYLPAAKAQGVHGIIREGVSVISVDPRAHVATLVHEFGHAVFAHRLAKLPKEQQDAMYTVWRKWQDEFNAPGKSQDATFGKGPVGPSILRSPLDAKETQISLAAKGNFSGPLAKLWAGVHATPAEDAKYARYFSNFDEFSAEQFSKFVEAEVAGLGKGNLSLAAQIFQGFALLIKAAAELFGIAKKQNLVKPDAAFSNFFDDLIVGNKAEGKAPLTLTKPAGLQQMATPAQPAQVVDELLVDPDFAKYGLTGLPVGTAAERKDAQAILAIHKKAAVWELANPMDDAWKKRMQNLSNNTVFNVASTGLTLLSSPSPVVRMIASQLLEDASGVAGKRAPTAAIHKYMVERAMLGNSLVDVQRSYDMWRVGKPGGVMDDLVGGKRWDEFNKAIASEIEARAKAGAAVSTDQHIKAATDSLEAAYQRTANEQRRVNTLGSEGLPESSVGYMPHRMNAKQFVQLSQAKKNLVHDVLVDQFVGRGWDMSFSDQLASKYLDMARKRAAGDYGTAMGGSNAASHVEEALRAMDLPEATIKSHMDKYTKGGANFTKGRLELDLNKVYSVDGEDFRLLDVFDTNQIDLIRAQVGRASGDVALTKFGVRGKPGADLLFNALQFGEDGKRGSVKDFEAYEQVMAEFFNEPYGKAGGKFLDRATLANAWVSMGSASVNQLSEVINGIAHVGFLRAMTTITDIPRLRRELLAKVKGQPLDNPLLDSIEHAGGAEFGADGYKYVMPHDSSNNLYPTYGQDTPTLVDRVLRGGGHLQAVLSGHRMLSAVQQRGMAEQIVHKMARYVRDGKDDLALDQFGIDANLRSKLRQDISQWATFDGERLVRFEADKITDPDVRDAVIQAVWRGTNQIIQGTFIGERGKWAHDGMLRMMTQFRSFSITSMEKQWGRQRNSRGTFGAAGVVLGAMSLAWPIYVARTYAQSIGRPDQEKFIEERLSTQHVARATMNYVAGLGMLPDLLDLGTQALPDDWGVKTTGGRAGAETDFVGNYIAPASNLVDNIWKYVQSPMKAEDAIKIMPFSRLPYVIPLLNNVRD